MKHVVTGPHEWARLLRSVISCLLLICSWPCRAQDASGARGDLKEQCADAYERTQRARKEGKLLEASTRAVFCGQDQCPAVLRGDCILWAKELTASLPSVVFEVRYVDGSEVQGLEVLVDGSALAPADLGRALSLDPGVHDFVFRDGKGAEQHEQRTIREGQQREPVRVRLAQAPAPHAPTSKGRARRVTMGVLLGTAVLSAGGLVGFAVHGKLRENELESRCAPRCNRARAQDIRRDYRAADVFMGVGAAALAASLTLFLSGERLREPRAPSTPRLQLQSSRHGAGLALEAQF